MPKGKKPPVKTETRTKKTASPASETPPKLFKTRAAMERWLEKNHAASPGIWLQIAKKGSGLSSVTYPEAVDLALCYGWIDSQMKGYDEQSYIQKFTPRGKKSLWSKINREKAERLTAGGQMKPAGMAAIDAARADGRWDGAYEGSAKATVPDDLTAALEKSSAAKAFFDSLDRVNRYAVLFRVQTASSPELRKKRIEAAVEKLARRERYH
jgi:uncharacterized protein YdeI (YjbR/CyaY-like superfamily)